MTEQEFRRAAQRAQSLMYDARFKYDDPRSAIIDVRLCLYNLRRMERHLIAIVNNGTNPFAQDEFNEYRLRAGA